MSCAKNSHPSSCATLISSSCAADTYLVANHLQESPPLDKNFTLDHIYHSIREIPDMLELSLSDHADHVSGKMIN